METFPIAAAPNTAHPSAVDPHAAARSALGRPGRALPAYYKAADGIARSARRWQFGLYGLELLLLVLGALYSAPTAWDKGRATAAFWLLLAGTGVGLTRVISYLYFEPRRLIGRAAAEVFKSRAWRYMMGAEPYDAPQGENQAATLFETSLRAVHRACNDKRVRLDKPARHGQITKDMAWVRGRPPGERTNMYVAVRVAEQVEWHAREAARSNWRLGGLAVAVVAMQGAAVYAGYWYAQNPGATVNLTGVCATAAAALLAWVQFRGYQARAAASGEATHELVSLKDRVERSSDEAEFLGLVGEVEDAISDEYRRRLELRDAPARARPAGSPAPDTAPAESGVRFIDKGQRKIILPERLGDESVTRVVIVAYTNETEASQLAGYHIKGEKTIEVFTRSRVVELREQQLWNLRRIARGRTKELWRKTGKMARANKDVADETRQLPHAVVTQWCYTDAPSKRAFLFEHADFFEAVVDCYEPAGDPMTCGGTIYKGENEGAQCAVITVRKDVRHGVEAFELEQLTAFIAGLRVRSYLWSDEPAVLAGRGSPTSAIHRLPCDHIGAVLFDLDLLYGPADTRAGAARKATAPRRPARSLIRRDARDLVGFLVGRSVQVGFVSGAPRTEAPELLVRDFGADFANSVISPADVGPGMPESELYATAARRTRVEPRHCVVIGSGTHGLRSAASAGMLCLAVSPASDQDEQAFWACGAAAVFPDCAAIAGSWELIRAECSFDHTP